LRGAIAGYPDLADFPVAERQTRFHIHDLHIDSRQRFTTTGETKLIAMEVNGFEAVRERTEIKFRLDARAARAGLIRDLAHLVKDYPGPSRVLVALETSMGPKTLALGPGYTVAIDTDFLTEARTLLGADAIV
jgi:hypothetical protein